MNVLTAITPSDFAVIAAVIGATVVVSLSLRVALRQGIRRLARRAARGSSKFWKVRIPRAFGETPESAELRRLQRIDATAGMISRLFSVALWLIAILFVVHRLDVDVTFAISGAGFLGAAVAFGGQHSVADYLTGIHVLLEDRYGEGDYIEVNTAYGLNVVGRVNRMATFATRIESDSSTWHIAHRHMDAVSNRSQRGFELTLDIPQEHERSADQLRDALTHAYSRSAGFDPAIDGLLIDNISNHPTGHTVQLRTGRPLTPTAINSLMDRLDDATAERKDSETPTER